MWKARSFCSIVYIVYMFDIAKVCKYYTTSDNKKQKKIYTWRVKVAGNIVIMLNFSL